MVFPSCCGLVIPSHSFLLPRIAKPKLISVLHLVFSFYLTHRVRLSISFFIVIILCSFAFLSPWLSPLQVWPQLASLVSVFNDSCQNFTETTLYPFLVSPFIHPELDVFTGVFHGVFCPLWVIIILPPLLLIHSHCSVY